MRIFAAGIDTETNTFCPVPTSREDFLVQRGKDARQGRIDHPSLDLAAIWGRQARARGDELVFSLMAAAQPSGITVRSAYESLRDEILDDLRAAMPVDVVLLMLHGAMVAQGYEDCEEDIIRRAREIVGSNVVIGAELDLHCHLSGSMLAAADIVITYKEYPHIDSEARAGELFTLAVDARLGKIRPTMALFDCHMVGLFPTTRQPMRGFVDSMFEAERRKGVLSVSFGHGFQFADVPHVGAKVLVVTDNDPGLAQEVARELGLRVYEMRREIAFDSLSLPMAEALARALASGNPPVVVADQSDNPGGGAPGDATCALRWLLEARAKDVAMAIFYDPEVVRITKKIGPGGTLRVRLGGKMGPFSGDPLDLEVGVLSIRDDYVHVLPQQSGEPMSFMAGSVVALRHGGIDLIVSSERCQCLCPSIFRDLGIDPQSKRLLVVKSAQHFYRAFAPIAGEVIYMAGPGAVPPNPKLVTYRRFETRDTYPWAEDPLAK